jgi:ubiquinone/menaquinone biosynthesis C-methylase UbiE
VGQAPGKACSPGASLLGSRMKAATSLKDRIKLFAFVLCGLAVLAGSRVGFEALNTLERLDVIEAERDQWQRPADVLRALELKPGDTVVDLGCGSGYFSLRLSSVIGSGRVLAEDIRKLPLVVLWLRSLQKHQRNIHVVHGEPSDPHLVPGSVNEVLIANTYHEFSDSQLILDHVRSALVQGGTLVVIDRAPNPADVDKTELGEHEIASEQVERELRHAEFAIVSRQDNFIDKDPLNEKWWIIVARKP